MQVEVEIFKIPYRLNYSDFYYIYYHYNVIIASEMHFSQLYSSLAFCKVYFEACKFSRHFFMLIPTIKY